MLALQKPSANTPNKKLEVACIEYRLNREKPKIELN